MKFVFLLLAFLAITITPAAAAEPTIGVHLVSWHSNPDACRGYINGPCNNTNPGLYVRTSGGWVAGGYYNSVERPTVYVGRSWTLAERGRASLDVAALAATGYPAAPVIPLVTPTAAWATSTRRTPRRT